MMKKLTTVALLLTLALTAGARNYVVLVGIANYPGTKNDLKLSAHDAITMKTLYDKNGDAVTDILTDSQATVVNVKAAINNLFARATHDDAVTLFFSGHGTPGGFVCHDGMLKFDDITTVMMKSDAHAKMVFADACFSGKVRKGKAHDNKPSESNVMFFLSSRTNERSMEVLGWRNSLFTAYLERGLRGGADTDHDRTITARELFDFVSQGVATYSINEQHPVMWGKFEDQMPIMTWRENSK